MKLDPGIYSEAQKLARGPRFKYLMFGLMCGAMVPTMAIRHYSLPPIPKDIMDTKLEELPVIKSTAARRDMTKQMSPPRSKSVFVDDDEATYILFSSIM